METRSELVCDAIKIDVHCRYPEESGFLGYYFVVSPDEDIEDLASYIKKTIEDRGGEFRGMSDYVVKDFFVKNLKSRDDIYIKINDL